MGEYIWIVNWMNKDTAGDVEAYITAVKAPDIQTGLNKGIEYINSVTIEGSTVIVTDIGIADACSETLIGHFIPDPIIGEWPEAL